MNAITGPVQGIVSRMRKAASIVRLKPFDVSTESGRSLERYRRAALSAFTLVFGKGLSLFASLLTIPLTLSYLGSERYGMWMTISSLITMVMFTDLGIGSGLIGAVSQSMARGDLRKAREYVSSGLAMVLLMASLVVVLFLIVSPLVPWPRVFNVHSPDVGADARASITAFVVCQALTVVGSVVGNLRNALQETFVNAIWFSVGSVLTLVGVLIAVWLKVSLPWLIVIICGAPLLATLGNTVLLFWRNHPEIMPSWDMVNRSSVRRLSGLGLLFLILQFSSALAFSSDNVVAAQIFGSEAVPQYTIPFRLFTIPMTIVMTLAGPLWPAYAEAIARGDAAWVRRTLVRSLITGVTINILASAFLLIFGNRILEMWVGSKVTPSFSLMAGFAIWIVLSAGGAATSMLFNGAHVFKFQAWTALTMAVSNLALSIILAHWIGLSGIIWGTVISYTVCCVIPWIVFVPRLLRNIQDHPHLPADADVANQTVMAGQ